MAIKVTRVQPGDIIEADNSWRINSVAFNDHSQLTVGQNFRTEYDKTKPRSVVWEGGGGHDIYYPREDFVDMNGPEACDSTSLKVGDEYVPIPELVQKEGIAVRGKNFIVTNVEKTSTYESCPREVTARESTPEGAIKAGGLTVKFQQLAPWLMHPSYKESPPPAAHPYVHEVKVLGSLFKVSP